MSIPSAISSPRTVATADRRGHLLGLSLERLRAFVTDLGEPAFRAFQLYNWIYARRGASFEEMSSLPAVLRTRLEESARLRTLTLLDRQQSADGTVKFLFRTHDALNIEAVLIPSEARDDENEPKRRTLCLSTQVGCPLDCRFCATGTMRMKRNLTAGEILEQFLQVEAALELEISNIVYMGMGEPMLNYEATFGSIDLFSDPSNRMVPASRITVSTSGFPAQIRRMADEGRRVKLALSLHAATNGLRDQLMPINEKWNLQMVLDAVEYYYRATRRPVTYEYIVFAGLNDTDEDVRRLARVTRRVPSKVNVIPFHDIGFTAPSGVAAELRAPGREHFDAFIAKLRAADVQVMVRSSSGEDIDAACGQLAIRHEATRLEERCS